jgi:hypothetical protein
VTISGEAGVGKTRLVRELWDRLSSETPEPLRRTGRCLPYGQGITYWPLGEILKEQFGILESDPSETVRDRLGRREILGLTLGLDLAGDLHPLAARDRLHAGWIDFTKALVAERPAVFLVEDIHWAEPPLLDLLERLLKDVRRPLLIVATARPELFDLRPGWGGARLDASTIELEALSSDDAVRLLRELVARQLPAHVTEMVVRQAEGNPFFVEEVIQSLIDQGVLGRVNGEWAVTDLPAEFSVPDSVTAVLGARIDLLPTAEKAALQAASVIGRVFWTGPVYELVPGLEPDFHVLEGRDFIRRRAGSTIAGETEYAFKHQLTREVAYAGLLKGTRARLHASFAAWLEGFGGGRDEHAALLAHHYAEAVRPEDADLAWSGAEGQLEDARRLAVHWLRRAAELAVGRYDIDDALDLLHRAVDLASAHLHVELWKRIGEANALKYDGEAFWAAMEKAISLSSDRQERGELYSFLANETTVRLGMWRTRPDRRMVRKWIDQALELTEGETEARLRALVALGASDSRQEVVAARDAAGLAEKLGKPELRVEAGAQLLRAELAAGHENDALAIGESLLTLVDEVRNPDEREAVFWAGVIANLAAGRIEEASRLTGLLADNARGLTPHHRLHSVAIRLMVEELAGRWEEVGSRTAAAEEAVAENLATPCVMNARGLLTCALAAAHAGDEENARRLERSANRLGMEGYGLTIDALRLRLALVRGDLETAGRLLDSEDAMYFAELAARAARLDALVALSQRDRVEDEATPLLRPNTYLEPFALRALGLAREDEALIGQALDRFERMGLDWHAAETRALL